MRSPDRARFIDLLRTPAPPALGPERRAGTLAEDELLRLLEPLLAHPRWSARRREHLTALLLLWHDHLDAAHRLAQSGEDADGNFIHAMVHRREPDAWNSKYWWRRVGDHPAFPELARQVAALPGAAGDPELKPPLIRHGRWQPDAFVDACVAAAQSSPTATWLTTLREIQRIETEALLGHLLAESE